MFSEHPKAKYWSNKNLVKPNKVALNSHKKFWFDCGECGHEFESSLLNINQSNNWCPYCTNKKLCENFNCKTCFDKSFASHEKANYWSNKNILRPNEVLKGSEKKIIFNCDKCPHEIEISIKKISCLGRWCSYCSHQKLCEDINCNMCFTNSFASIERSKYLHDKSINPRTLFKSTNKKFEFDCSVCNKVFSCQLSGVTTGVWCSYCVNKTEKKFYDIVVKIYSNVIRQYKVDWCKNIKHLPFDFVIEERKIIIEQDGPQHFKQVGNWQSVDETRERDLYKMKCANENGYSVIRLLQKDIFHDKYDWFSELQSNIEKITSEGRVQNIYMCKNNEYKDFDIS